MSANADPDPWGNYYFSLELNQVVVAHFMECSGLKSSSAVFEIEEGGMNEHVHKRTGYAKWENLVLQRAISKSTELEAWRDKFLTGKFNERLATTGAIVVRDNAGEELRRYNFHNGWPVSWEGPTLNAGGSDLATETLEIAHDGLYIDRATPEAPVEEPPAEQKLETEPVQFEFDSAELTPEGEEVLDDVNDQVEEQEIEEMWIEGHTCNMGSHSYNKTLSQQRADSCKANLEAKGGSTTYHSTGYAFDHPVASNSTSAGRSTNRRTEFWNEPRSGKRPGEL